MGSRCIKRSVIFLVGFISAIADCQQKVKIIQFSESVSSPEFNSINENDSLIPRNVPRIFSLPLFANVHDGRQQGICDERCGLANDGGPSPASSRVIGGSTAKPNQFPWMVQLVIVIADFFQEKQLSCGATLIKQQYLLTAAHCVYHLKVLSITALVGFHYLDIKRFGQTGFEQMIPVAKAYIHEEFDPIFMKNDIAILELASPVRFTNQVHTICLTPKEAIQTDSYASIAGWGVTQAFGTQFYPQMLLTADVPLISTKDCRKSFVEVGQLLNEQTICAGGSLRDACLGDSGGPLMITKNATISSPVRYNQLGIVSWGRGCGLPDIPAVYVNIQHYLTWIQDVTRKDTCLPYSPN